MKIAVYTSITNAYDGLKPFGKQSPDIDFICFTDYAGMFNNNWMIKPIPNDVACLPWQKQQRMIKILPHRYLKDYDISLWIDANIQITCDIMKFIQEYDMDEFSFYTRKHPTRDCYLQESRSILRLEKDRKENILPVVERYRSEGMPEHFGMVESGIILRKHNKPTCIKLDNLWGQEVLKGSHRDQLSFNYCLWKLNFRIGYLKVNNLKKNPYFKWCRHGK